MATRRIVVGVDGSAGSAAAVRWCASFASALDAEVVAVHAVDFPLYPVPPLAFTPPPPDAEWRTALRETLDDKWCAPLREAGVRYRAVVVEGAPAIAALDSVTAEEAELLVVGRRGHGGFAGLVLGSVADYVAHHATVPVVIVPASSSNAAR